MRPWKLCSILTLALGLGALGCGGGSSPTTVTVTISPTIASVITNTTQTFTPFVNGTTDAVVTWAVTCPTSYEFWPTSPSRPRPRHLPAHCALSSTGAGRSSPCSTDVT